jgi:hypothetical protein
LSQIFPKWTNELPLWLGLVSVVVALSGVAFFWYYGSPKYTDAGYRPTQPVEYSHKLHAGDLGIDCRYCHVAVETSAVASVPPVQTCMNCHTMVKTDSEKLEAVRSSYASGQPIEWVRIHNVPDYAYFDHAIHIDRGVGCVSCHGRVDQMVKVIQEEPLSMGWCLDCHRNPDQHLRPADQVTNMAWEAPVDQAEFATKVKETLSLDPPEDCSGCHR